MRLEIIEVFQLFDRQVANTLPTLFKRSTLQRSHRPIRQRPTETDVKRERGSQSSQRRRQERQETGATIRKCHVP